MRKLFCLLMAVCLSGTLLGCQKNSSGPQIAATTAPVAQFATALCAGTDITVKQLVTENVSCLHDYSLQARQMQVLEASQLVVLNGAGLENFLEDALSSKNSILDSSVGISLRCSETEHADHHHEHEHAHDSHIWLSIQNAEIMATNICKGLTKTFPQHQVVFEDNLSKLKLQFAELSQYAKAQLSQLSCRKIITFHDGFSYMAAEFGLEIVHAIEEESGSEASAAELIALSNLVKAHRLPAIFTECNGSTSAAEIVSRQTGVMNFPLDMAMGERDYFTAMRYNIDTLKEALG